VFYLTVDELCWPLPADAPDRIAARRETRQGYSTLRLPVHWQGLPHPLTADDQPDIDVPLRGRGVTSGARWRTQRSSPVNSGSRAWSTPRTERRYCAPETACG
jgi:hypothetical protein